MSKRDTLKVAKYEVWAYEWRADSKPSKSLKNIKVKERQQARQIIKKERKVLGK